MVLASLCLVGSMASAQTPPTVEDLLRLLDVQQTLIDEQGLRIDALQQQLDDLRGHAIATPATDHQARTSAADPDRRGKEPEAPADVVRAGDFPGSFTIPGSDVAFKLGGLVRVNSSRASGGRPRTNSTCRRRCCFVSCGVSLQHRRQHRRRGRMGGDGERTLAVAAAA
jgi:hypothetical protein